VIGTLYRYPHPHDANKFIYCGQGANRDKDHRCGKSSFGRRFKRDFPKVELPQPIREQVEVVDQEHLNSMETAWMVLYNTLRSFGGMNLLLPGSADYEVLGKVGGSITAELRVGIHGLIKEQRAKNSGKGGRISGRANKENRTGIFAPEMFGVGGRKGGRKNVENGHLASISAKGGRKGGRISGRKAVENGHLASIRCLRWNVRRGKSCICGTHKAA
jgi:hypothetical protein